MSLDNFNRMSPSIDLTSLKLLLNLFLRFVAVPDLTMYFHLSVS
jgi:hypothetical protein